MKYQTNDSRDFLRTNFPFLSQQSVQILIYLNNICIFIDNILQYGSTQ